MEKNQRYIVIGVIVIALIAGWQLLRQPAQVGTENQNQEEKPSVLIEEQGDESSSNQMTIKDSENVWEGTLKNSDNTSKGNLMLVTKDHNIYIKTSRDFSQLLGKEVKATYEGSLESFRLGEIVAK